MHVERHPVPEATGFRRVLSRTALRGLAALADAMHVGVRALQVAVRIGTGDELTRPQLLQVFGVLGVSVLVVFVAGPGVAAAAIPAPDAVADVAEGTGRLAMFVLYLALVARSASGRRLFSYHGAEHKTIAAFERRGGMPAVDDARASSPVHPRCGTNFLTLCVLVAGVVYAFVPRSPVWTGAAWRVLLVPAVAVGAYELMRIAARSSGAVWARVVTMPGRTAQRLTTREPSPDQLEVAMAAIGELLRPDHT
ncbi:MAG: DUF1385 domain-containing protein [Candidatus Binatia bacterium]